MLKCKKSIAYHWGPQFEEGKIYQISEYLERSVDVITEYDEYWKMSRIVAASGQHLQNNIKDPNEIEKRLPGYIKSMEYIKNKSFKKKILLPFVSIKSDCDRTLHYFCSLSDKEISEKYNIDLSPKGKIPFTSTVNILCDYFDYISDIRNKKLGDLGIF